MTWQSKRQQEQQRRDNRNMLAVGLLIVFIAALYNVSANEKLASAQMKRAHAAAVENDPQFIRDLKGSAKFQAQMEVNP